MVNIKTFLNNSALIALILLLSVRAHAQKEFTFASPDTQTNLMEVYVSQGCSSCPPAQDWLNRLVNDPRLWKDFIPVVFHVDYWDYLGWRDPFGSHVYTQRQRQYRNEGLVGGVYTPGFVVNGKEWRGWFQNKPLSKSNKKTGILEARIESGQLTASYKSTRKDLVLNVAVLGFGLETFVKRGENRNRHLPENFVVLAFENHFSEHGNWKVALPDNLQSKAKQYALVLWVSPKGSLTPLQAAGTWLPANI